MKRFIITSALILLSATRFPVLAQESAPPYEMTPLQAYSLFYENYRSKQYDMALQFGEWMLVANPKTIEGNPQFTLEKQYERFVEVYAGIAKQQADPTVRMEYYDKVKDLFARLNTVFAKEEIDRFQWQITKGQFYQQNYASIPGALDSTYAAYQEAFNLDYRRLTEISDGYYVRILIENYTTRKEKEMALSVIDKVEPLASPSLMDVINASRDRLFDSPEERIAFLETRVESDPGNAAILSELADLLEENGQRGRAIQLYTRLYELEPSFENTLKLARIESADGKYKTSNTYMLLALERAPDDEQKKQVAIEISENFQSLEDLANARTYARQASSIDRNWDRPYIQIAGIYAAAVSACTQGRSIEREDRTVYWLVLDYMDRARSVNSAQSASFQRSYAQYEAVMPTTEDKFFSSWTVGESFKIDSSLNACYGWINESTKIR